MARFTVDEVREELKSNGYKDVDKNIRVMTHGHHHWGVIPEVQGKPITEIVRFGLRGDGVDTRVLNCSTPTTSLLSPDDPDYFSDIFRRFEAASEDGIHPAGALVNLSDHFRLNHPGLGHVRLYTLAYSPADCIRDYCYAETPVVNGQLAMASPVDDQGVSVCLNQSYRAVECPSLDHPSTIYGTPEYQKTDFDFELPEVVTEEELRRLVEKMRGEWIEDDRSALTDRLKTIRNSLGAITGYMPISNNDGVIVYLRSRPLAWD